MVLAAIAVVIILVIWNSGSLEGSGTLETSVSPFYPRHRIRFDAVQLNSDAENEFRFHGAPASRMDFIFSLAGTPRELDVISRSDSIIEVELLETAPQPRRICKATGRPSGTEYSSRWVVGGPSGHPDSLWHSSCLKFDVESDAEYLLRISIRPGADREAVKLVPTLEGGGIKIES